MQTDAVKAAIIYATNKHKDQKYGETSPYTEHLAHVAEVLRRFKHDSEELQIAAWLHDVVEDTDTSLFQVEILFGRSVADLVGRVTNEPGKNRKERHKKTYPKIQASKDATTLKLADRIANVERSVQDKSRQMGMYKKEHKLFKTMLYKEGEHDKMWSHLDFLIGEDNA